MAFVFKSERDSSPNSSRVTPGPGQYVGQEAYKFDHNQAPFLSNSAKIPENDPTFDIPESSRQFVVIKNSLKGNGIPAKPLGQAPNSARPSVNFQSKVERFNEPMNDCPGPGSYSRNSRMGKRYNKPPLDSSRNQASERILQRNKSVPSIPSQIHSHGYCEGANGNLVLNEHPIEETQQLPGTRMHEMKDVQAFNKKVKGAPWSKTSEKTVQSYIPKMTTVDTVGPGAYEISERGSITDRRMSVGFRSTVDRSCSVSKIRRSNSTTRIRPSYSSGLPSLQGLSQVIGKTDDDGEDSDECEEYVKDCTPGPGYYYNASTASSFYSKAPSMKSRKSEVSEGNRGLIFGQGKIEPLSSGTERFKDRASAAGNIGPGEYEIKREIIKKEMSFKRIPFRTSDLRFEKSKMLDVPGPGAYKVEPKFGKEYKKEKEKEDGDKSVSMVEGLPGSKVKIEDVLHESKKLLKNKTPGPGDYNPKVMSEIGKNMNEERESFNFASKVRREALGNNPSVGTYNVNYYDMATKIIKEREEEELDLSTKRPGFGSSNARFKDDHLEESDDDDEEVNWKPKRDLASVLRAQQPPKKSAMFASKVKKMVGEEEKNTVPGPGSYHNPRQSGWNKQTFNVNFSKATYT